jgi:hypothetical protein
MRQRVIFSLLGLAALALGGCSTTPKAEGVLPREAVPPPPSVDVGKPQRSPTPSATGAQLPRRSLSVPDRLVPPRPGQ